MGDAIWLVSHGKNLIQSDVKKTVNGRLILEVIFNLVPPSKRCEKSLPLIFLLQVEKFRNCDFAIFVAFSVYLNFM